MINITQMKKKSRILAVCGGLFDKLKWWE